MNEISVEEYIDVLNGGKRGTQFSKNYYIISREEKKKPSKTNFVRRCWFTTKYKR